MKHLVYLFLALISFSQEIDLSKELFEAKHYIVAKSNTKIIIDGKTDEAIWESVPFTDSFIDIEGVKKVKFNTKVKMLWDDNFLYIYAKMEEPHIWGDITKRDAVIFYNNDFEVFISPSSSTINYAEIEINALNTVWDLFLNKAYRVGGRAVNYWNLPDLKTAVHIEGTLNDSSDRDSYWSVELAIPMKALLELKRYGKQTPVDGEQWRINFSRVQWNHEIIDGKYQRKKTNGTFDKEYNWVWTNQGAINMHMPERWGYLQFSTSSDISTVQFKRDKDVLFKQLAYALFRQTRYSKLKYIQKEEPGKVVNLSVKYTNEDTLDVDFFKTHSGFEYILTSPISKIVYIINEEGNLISRK